METTELRQQGAILGLPSDVRSERIRLIQVYWKALNTGDMKTFESLLAPDAVIHYPGQHYLSGDYRTTKDIVRLYTLLSSFAVAGVFQGEVLDILVGETYTSVCLRYTLNLPFKTIPGRAMGVFIIVDRKIKEYWLHEWDQVMINRVFRLTRMFGPFQRFLPKPPRPAKPAA